MHWSPYIPISEDQGFTEILDNTYFCENGHLHILENLQIINKRGFALWKDKYKWGFALYFL